MIELYGFGKVHKAVAGLTRDLRILWTLEETGASYRVHEIDHFAGDNKAKSYHALNPFEQVPTIKDDDLVLTESGAIVLYIAEKQGRLIPKDLRGRAEVMRWCFAALTTVEPPLAFKFLMPAPKDSSDTKSQDQLASWTERVLRPMDERLGSQDWLATDQFTVADILFCSVLRLGKRAGVLDPYQNLNTYRTRCEERPAWGKIVAEYEDRLGYPRGTANF
jgi:glutathione S-transferase